MKKNCNNCEYYEDNRESMPCNNCILNSLGTGGSLGEWSPSTQFAEILIENLTPSAETKAAFMGEFKMSEHGNMYVPWDTVKNIMNAVLNRAIEQNEDRI